MEDFLKIDMADAFILNGMGVAMSMDSSGALFYALQLEGTVGKDSREAVVTVIIPPMYTEQFLAVMRVMEPVRE